MWPFRKKQPQPFAVPTLAPRSGGHWTDELPAVDEWYLTAKPADPKTVKTWELPKPMPGVMPESGMAMDNAPVTAMFGWALTSMLREGLGFLGYPYLAELSQRPEYRRICEIPAEAMTRRWIKLRGDETKVATIEAEMIRLKVVEKFRRIAELDAGMGRSHLYLDFEKPLNDAEPLVLAPETVPKGSLKGLTVIEPVWCYPLAYNSTDPRAKDFYKPTMWAVMGNEVHATRLLLFVGREMPDMLKPAYQFGGLAMTQMAKPYVDNWLRTRQSVSDLIKSFSVMVLKTDMQALVQKAGALLKRVSNFIMGRDNKGLMVLDKDEEFQNVSASLSTLDKLQAQAQEHICSVSGIPLVEYTGITPAGLNATSEGEIETWHGHVKDDQEHLFRDHLETVIKVIQLSELGAIDESITFEFVHLTEMTDKEKADLEKVEADTDAVLIDAGVISNEEARNQRNEDEASPYYQKLTGPAPEEHWDASAENDDVNEPLAVAAE